MQWPFIVQPRFSLFTESSAKVLTTAFKLSANSPPPPALITDITQEQANKLFAQFKKDKEISYPTQEGCFAKATAMAMIAEVSKIHLGKIFAEPLPDPQDPKKIHPLLVKPNGNGPMFWRFHSATVASVISVVNGKKGTKLVVFDPFLFDHPVSIEEWKSSLRYEGYRACQREQELCDEAHWKSYCPADRKDCIPLNPPNLKIYFGNRFQYHPLSGLGNSFETYQRDYNPKYLRNVAAIFSVFRKYRGKELDIVDLQKTVRFESDSSGEQLTMDSSEESKGNNQ